MSQRFLKFQYTVKVMTPMYINYRTVCTQIISNIMDHLKCKWFYLQKDFYFNYIIKTHCFRVKSSLSLCSLSWTPLGLSKSPGKAAPPTKNRFYKTTAVCTGTVARPTFVSGPRLFPINSIYSDRMGVWHSANKIMNMKQKITN